MEYAVIENGGKQYKVASGAIIDIDRANGVKDSVTFEKVLLYVKDGGEVAIGKPYLANVTVQGKVIKADVVGKKVRVARFTAKSRHRRVVGFRPRTTQVQIEKIVSKQVSTASSNKTPVSKKKTGK